MTTIGSAATVPSVGRSLRRATGRGRDGLPGPAAPQPAVLARPILAVLIADVLVTGDPGLPERGVDFLTSPLSSDPSKAGIARASSGPSA